MYKFLVRPLFFRFKPETIHNVLLFLLKGMQRVPISLVLLKVFNVRTNKTLLERTVFGINFTNPVGLAAGLDKNAVAVKALGKMGFSHVEIGTVTPLAQPGNPKPRIFRIKNDKALINRMGFNNLGVKAVINSLKRTKTDIIIGGNIGKNKNTPNENAINDYEKSFEALYPYVDYFVVNVSSPNTPNLRELQEKEPLGVILGHLKQLSEKKNMPKPILLKIAPDLSNYQLDDVIEIVLQCNIDGIVATNTTISREGLSISSEQVEKIGNGGLSGKPLTKRSTEVIKYIHQKSGGKIPIIGVGGIMTAQDAIDKLEAGASLVQIYTGFIYEGPALIKRINKAIINQQLKNK